MGVLDAIRRSMKLTSMCSDGAEFAKGLKADGTPHKFSNTQLMLPDDVAAQVKVFALSIPDGLIGPDGRQDDVHITSKYGIHSNDAGVIRQLVETFGPVKATLGKTSLFKNEDADVLKIDCKGKDLFKLNALLSDNLECTDKHPEYMPHCTIAYLLPGQGDAYAGDDRFDGIEVELTSLVFCPVEGEDTAIEIASYAYAEKSHDALRRTLRLLSQRFVGGGGKRRVAAHVERYATKMLKANPDVDSESRDDHGRWTSGGGSAGAASDSGGEKTGDAKPSGDAAKPHEAFAADTTEDDRAEHWQAATAVFGEKISDATTAMSSELFASMRDEIHYDTGLAYEEQVAKIDDDAATAKTAIGDAVDEHVQAFKEQIETKYGAELEGHDESFETIAEKMKDQFNDSIDLYADTAKGVLEYQDMQAEDGLWDNQVANMERGIDKVSSMEDNLQELSEKLNQSAAKDFDTIISEHEDFRADNEEEKPDEHAAAKNSLKVINS